MGILGREPDPRFEDFTRPRDFAGWRKLIRWHVLDDPLPPVRFLSWLLKRIRRQHAELSVGWKLIAALPMYAFASFVAVTWVSVAVGAVLGHMVGSVLGEAIAAALSPVGRQRIHKAPGFTLLRVTEFFFSKKTYKEVLLPAIQDMQDEYMEATAEGDKRKAQWVRVRGTWSVLNAAALSMGFSLVSSAVRLWRLIG